MTNYLLYYYRLSEKNPKLTGLDKNQSSKELKSTKRVPEFTVIRESDEFFPQPITPVIKVQKDDIFDFDFFGPNFEDYSNNAMKSSKSKLKMIITSTLINQGSRVSMQKSYSTGVILKNKQENSEFVFLASGNKISKEADSPCEDAFFVHNKALGIADGVGGWANFGINC